VHIKSKLRAKALDANPSLQGKYRPSFYARQLKPLFTRRYEGSSSETDSDEEASRQQQAKHGRRDERRQDKQLQAKIDSMAMQQQQQQQQGRGTKAQEEEAMGSSLDARQEGSKTRKSKKFGLKR
jgi:hypothetical protein